MISYLDEDDEASRCDAGESSSISYKTVVRCKYARSLGVNTLLPVLFHD